MATLTITQSPGGQVGKHFLVKHRPLAGGRHPSQEIQLLDAEVSRRHFLIRVEDEEHVIFESQGANGVYVNGAKVKEHKLQDGDEIQVGTTLLVYSKQDLADQTDEVQHQRRGDRRVREGGTVLHDPVIHPPKRTGETGKS
jgi:pSer/pThr/pTyr-binding forkhead associated (FHA) protein